MKTVLENYLGKEVGINYEKPFKIDAAKLVHVADDYFSIVDDDKGYTHHFAWASIVQIIENADGVDIGGVFSHKQHFSVVVKVGHILEYVPA